MAPWFEWDPGGFLYWSDSRLANDSLLRDALDEIVSKQYGDVSENYARVALGLARAAADVVPGEPRKRGIVDSNHEITHTEHLQRVGNCQGSAIGRHARGL